jgi:serine/threonine protein kinase/Tol biopolymer transport system component
LIGSVISRYEVLERIGEGTFGVVYKARDRELERLVALRVVPAHRGSAEDRQRLLAEAALLAALDHPHVGAVYEAGETASGDLFLAAAFCAGEPLSLRLERGPLKLAVAVDLAAQIAAALACVHREGVLHRNLRPSNVFVTADGQAKVVDFGLPGIGEQTLFASPWDGGLPTTAPGYASPEQLSGERLDAGSDLWSLGALLHEMVTGRRPSALLRPEPLSALRPDAPTDLERIVARATARLRADRYADAEEMRRDLKGLRLSSTHGSPAAVAGAIPAAEPRMLGPYRLLARIGAGGMGVIWRAEDSRIGRVVALKLLSPGLARDFIAKARFQQEARAATALEHPNVCTVYEVGETPEGQLYLTMPCYEGVTLRERLESGPLPVPEAVDVARQVARGLAKAHRQGIVHRDIKPANLMLTTDGVVKILDFGIAKLAGAAGVTRTGSTVGTPAYMSPEQMRGQEVDARSDLWSLGVVLYEMLAGRRPFPGDHESVVRNAILAAEPEPLSQVRPEVPAETARIAHGLLAKDPASRIPTADRLLAEMGPTGSFHGAGPTPARGRRRAVWALAAVLAVAAFATLAILAFRGRSGGDPAPPAPLRTDFNPLLTDQDGRETFPSLAPAGDYFVYVRAVDGNADIYLQRTAGGNPIDLTADSPAEDTQPAWSPDGSQIAFRSERDGGGIFLMGATGESVRRLTTDGYNPAWSPDGREIVYATEGIDDPVLRSTDSRLWRVEVAGRRTRAVASGDAVQPSWSPHGLRLAWWGRSHEGAQRTIWTAAPDGSSAVKAVDDGSLAWNPVWSPDGRYLYYASDRSGSMSLWRLPIDEATGRPRGDSEPVPTPSSWSGLLSLSHDGRRIAYASNESKANVERVAFDPERGVVTGPLVAVTQGSRSARAASASPDGRWIAFDTSGAPREDLFLVRPDGSGLRRLTDDAAKDRIPRWSPDGSRLLFYSNRGGKYEAWTIRPDGSGLEQETKVRGEPVFDPFWAPDGRRIAAGLGFVGLAVIDLDKPLPQRLPAVVPLPGKASFVANDWSPDGERLAGFDDSEELSLFSFRTRTLERLGQHGRSPVWLFDSRRLIYQRDSEIRLFDTRTRQDRRVLTPPPGSSFLSAWPTADGRALILVRAVEEGNIGMVSLP